MSASPTRSWGDLAWKVLFYAPASLLALVGAAAIVINVVGWERGQMVLRESMKSAANEPARVALGAFQKCQNGWFVTADECEVNAVQLVRSRGLDEAEASKAVQSARAAMAARR